MTSAAGGNGVKLTHLMTPVRIGKLEIKNRVVRSAHTTAIGGGTLSEDLIAYHEARAKGGVGLSVIEALAVHPTSLAPLNMIDPTLGDQYKRMVDRMRPHGMRVFQQLFHAGRHGRTLDGSPPWAPSDRPGVETAQAPLPMTKTMIDTIVGAYADASEKLKSWGCDGVEFHAGHGFLPQQFLSTFANDREDDYGGSLENRARFTMEALAAMRSAVGPDFVVGIRLSPDMLAGGVGVEDNLAVAQMAEAAGLVDYISISSGTFQTMDKTIGGMHEPVGFEMPVTTPITEKISVPTIIVGRYRTLEEADQAIRSGDGDLVAMVRATIAEPDLVKKTLDGHPERVRPCIGCNQGCIGQLLVAPNRMGCAVNPAVGFELKRGDDRLEPVSDPKKILVIGGGPAGMEAARVAALKGHEVVLAEAEADLGGAAKLAARAPTRGGLGDILVWLQDEVYRLGVDVRTSTYMDLGDVEAIEPDLVVLATGSMPRLDGIQLSNPGEPIDGIDHAKVISSAELFQQPLRDWGASAVVIDDTGHYEAIACAETLATAGVKVNFITRHAAFAPLVEAALMTDPALRRLTSLGVGVHTRTRVLSIDDEGVVAAPTFLESDTNHTQRLPANTVVFVSRNRPNRDMAEELREKGISVQLVGDANMPRFLPDAIREGNLAGAAA
ncbi:oxidoreductase [Henriciella litoralis]|uniref:oxidoreductase n=1 Tax=Henriciella litoralis TaxID=568102 RepID=UPI000A0457C5|nr:FAD-dependent oxidoreductase [Henriciella litoralis]